MPVNNLLKVAVTRREYVQISTPRLRQYRRYAAMESADKITLTLSILDKNFLDDLLKEATSLSRRYGFEVYRPYFGPAFDAEAPEQTPVITLELGMNLALSPFADWLYERLRGRSDSEIEINGTKVQVEKEAIERIVTVEMKTRSRKTTHEYRLNNSDPN